MPPAKKREGVADAMQHQPLTTVETGIVRVQTHGVLSKSAHPARPSVYIQKLGPCTHQMMSCMAGDSLRKCCRWARGRVSSPLVDSLISPPPRARRPPSSPVRTANV